MLKMVCPSCDKEIILTDGDRVYLFADDGWDKKSTAIILGYSSGVDIIRALCPDCLVIKDIIE
jgi:hypothetical protein